MGLTYSASEMTFLVSMSRSSLDALGPELAEALVSELREQAEKLGKPDALHIRGAEGQPALLADPDVFTDLPAQVAAIMERHGRKGVVVDTMLADLKDMALHLQQTRGLLLRDFHDRPDIFAALAETGYPSVDAPAPVLDASAPDTSPEP